MGRTKSKPKRLDASQSERSEWFQGGTTTDEMISNDEDSSIRLSKKRQRPVPVLDLIDSDDDSNEFRRRHITKMKIQNRRSDITQDEKKDDKIEADTKLSKNDHNSFVQVIKCQRKKSKMRLKLDSLNRDINYDVLNSLRSYRLAMTELVDALANEHYLILSPQGISALLNLLSGFSKKLNDIETIKVAIENNLIEMTVVALDLLDSFAVDIYLSLTSKAFLACSPQEVGYSMPLKRCNFQKKNIDNKDLAIMLQDAFKIIFSDDMLSHFLMEPRNKQNRKSKTVEESVITAQMIYHAVDNAHISSFEDTEENTDGKMNHQLSIQGLVPRLRKYQEAAVKWMVQRESGDCTYSGWEICWFVFVRDGGETKVDPLYSWRKQQSCSNADEVIMYNPFAGWLVKGYNSARLCTVGIGDIIKGGILAETMGLGKTVEILACILMNPSRINDKKPDFSDFDNDDNISHLTECEEREDLICYCGKGSENTYTMSWVFCQKCQEPMHGLCAGFESEEELMQKTKPKNTLTSKQRPLQICHPSRCPSCFAGIHGIGSGQNIESRATLIITPPSILSQWEREIRFHTRIKDEDGTFRPLKVLTYAGVKEICSMSHKQAREHRQRRLIHSQVLSNADIVLTTFQTLMSELSHSDDNPYVSSGDAMSKRLSRRSKKYRVVPSPLLNIKWWRVALDEAQRVETPTAASARMALKLTSHHRWAVSGTPVGKGRIDDLHGLLLFLRTTPFDHINSFRASLKSSYPDMNERIRHALHDIFWRCTKQNSIIRDQMGIPEMIEKKTTLKFSSVEKHFYMRQLEETILAAQSIFASSGKKRKEKDLEILTHQLRRLRAACCHPQVGSSGIKVRKGQTQYSAGGTSIATGVLSMSQILDHLIEDAKLKAEEAQRVFVLHSNSIAALYRLRSESYSQRVIIDSNDEVSLLRKSISVYTNTLEAAKSNSCPTATVGDALVSGPDGFWTRSENIRDGSVDLTWRFQSKDHVADFPEVWAKFDFSQKKKINAVAVRPLASKCGYCDDSASIVIYPKDCVLQVSNPVCGGIFVDALTFQMSAPGDDAECQLEWEQFEGFGPEKSKIWKIVVKSFHSSAKHLSVHSPDQMIRLFTGINLQMMEPEIELDILQNLHILHNAAISMEALCSKLDIEEIDVDGERQPYSREYLKAAISQMNDDKMSLEAHQTEAKQLLQRSAQSRLDEITKKRIELIDTLSTISTIPSIIARNDEVVPWYYELLSALNLLPDRRMQVSLASHVEDALFDHFNRPTTSFGDRRTFPIINTFSAFQITLRMRLESNPFYSEFENTKENIVFDCINDISNLGDTPSATEIYENSTCHKCRADWNQTGPKCSCCKLEERLAECEVMVKDEEILCVLQSICDWVNRNADGLQRPIKDYIDLDAIIEKMDLFFEMHSTVAKEITYARSKWRTHLDLLSRLDELNSCKSTRRLALEGESWDMDQVLVVHPRDIPAILMDDLAKQAMAEGTLRKSKELLRFLKNQNIEQKLVADEAITDDLRNTCSICLETFTAERAVLRCGHMYHYKPCLERLLMRGGNNTVVCPMRCAIRTKRDDIMIASDIKKDDGSKLQTKIEGSWGTKVDRLVSDLISVSQRGEKSIVFSQWLDMLDIVEAALRVNSIKYTRPKSIKRIGECLHGFRTTSCNVLLMDTKHGAEGLTIVEANHVFMIEPLLNHSIDSQAINRIHRLGQTCKTYVHRYIIDDTVEVKIDRLRCERQSHDGEDEVFENPKTNKCLSAGGVDGGFDESELRDLLSG